VRLGIGAVRGIGEDLAKQIAAGRPYSDVEDLARRCTLTRTQLESLATAGAFASLGDHDRRRAIWTAGAAAQVGADRLPGIVVGMDAPQLPGMDDWEEAVADLWATGVAPDGHPTRFLRADLDRRGALSAAELRTRTDGEKVLVAGVVTHRQRPATAAGVTFMNLEDETGLINVVVSRGCWQRYRHVAGSAPALLVSGRLERSVDDVVNVVATRIELLPVVASVPARNFR
jgi:error-prone DNA polymerase